LNCGVRRHAFDFHLVDFLDSIVRGGDEVCEVAVVGEQQQTFGVEVEASDG
jgi:hypothetical protein